MKKLIILLLIFVLILTACSGNSSDKFREHEYSLPPELSIKIWGYEEKLPKGAYSWNVEDENGKGFSEETEMSSYDEWDNIPYFDGLEQAEIILPEGAVSYTVTRWERGTDYDENNGETVEVSADNIIEIPHDGKECYYSIEVRYEIPFEGNRAFGSCEYVFCSFSRILVTETYTVVDGAESGNLVLAGSGENEVYTLNAKDVPVFLDGKEATASAIEDGMKVEIVHDGMVLELFPAMFANVKSVNAYSRGTMQNPMGSCYDLCGLYLEVLDDLWERDKGLNEGVDYVSIDLSDAPAKLTEGEKAALIYVFGQKHGFWALDLTMDELKEEGYLTVAGGSEDIYQWDNGVLLSISAKVYEKLEEGEDPLFPETVHGLPHIAFNAMKWRGPLAAYMFMDCTAVWPQDGTWTDYNIGAEAIS